MKFTLEEVSELMKSGYELTSPDSAVYKSENSNNHVSKNNDGTTRTLTHSRIIYGPGKGQWLIFHTTSIYKSFNDWLTGDQYPPKQQMWYDQNENQNPTS